MDNQYTSHIWNFSDSSQPYLQRLNKLLNSETNKWTEKFNFDKQVIIATDNECSVHNILTTDNNENLGMRYEELCKDLDTDPTSNFDNAVELCLKDNKLYHILATNLSITTIEKLCEYIFKEETNKIFIESVCKYFLPVVLKKYGSLDVLVNVYKTNFFKTLLEVLFKDKEISNNILQEFVKTLNVDEKTNFVLRLMNMDISKDEYVRNLYAIYIVYKDCVKSQAVQDYMLSKLNQISDVCVYDKNFGRILLGYIQAPGHKGDLKTVDQLVHTHESPFKRTCLNAFNELNTIDINFLSCLVIQYIFDLETSIAVLHVYGEEKCYGFAIATY